MSFVEINNKRIAFFFSILLTCGGLFDIFQKFFGASATLSISSPKWIFVILVYLAAFAITAALSLSIKPPFTVQIRLLYNMIISKIFPWNFAFVAAIIGAFGTLLLFSPLNRLFLFNLNSVILNFPIILLLIVKASFLLQKNQDLEIGNKEILVAIFLYFAYFVLGLNLIYYQVFNVFIVLLSSSLICLVYSSIRLETVLAWLKSSNNKYNLTFIAMLVLFAFSLYYFLVRSVNGAITLPSIMDEGSYAIKGLLFTTGKYIPYQPYGPWTNKMPLAFMIPGWIQQLFGRGIAVIRFSSFALQVIVIILLFFLGNRLKKPYGGILAVSLFVINPALQNFYSLGNSQVVSIFLLTLSLIFSIGGKRTLTELVAGDIFAAILVLTRENLAPYLIFLNLFFIWKYGLKKSAVPILAGISVFIVGHWAFWPGILKVWAKWVPDEISRFLDPYRYFGGGRLMWDVTGGTISPFALLSSLVQGISSNYISLLSLIGLPFLFGNWKKIKEKGNYKEFVFLFITLVVLDIAHSMIITKYEASCVYCLSSYLAFYLPMGILLFVLSLELVEDGVSRWKAAAFSLVSYIFYLGYWFNYRQSLESMLYTKLPSATSESGFQAIFVTIQQIFQISSNDLKIYFPLFVGTILFVLVLLLLSAYFSQKNIGVNRPAHLFPTLIVIIVGLTLITDVLVNVDFQNTYCEGNVIAAHKKVDTELKKIFPIGSKIFWLGESTTPFLTLDVEIFPQQINDGFAYKVGSKDDLAERHGFWNENLAKKWSKEADFLMIEERYLTNPIFENVDLASFNKIAYTSRLEPCVSSSRYLIFQKK